MPKGKRFEPTDRIIRRVKAMRADNHTAKQIADSTGAPINWVTDQVKDTPLRPTSSPDVLEKERQRYHSKKVRA